MPKDTLSGLPVLRKCLMHSTVCRGKQQQVSLDYICYSSTEEVVAMGEKPIVDSTTWDSATSTNTCLGIALAGTPYLNDAYDAWQDCNSRMLHLTTCLDGIAPHRDPLCYSHIRSRVPCHDVTAHS